MTSNAQRSSSRKAIKKTFYKVAKVNKKLSMAVDGKGQAVAGAMPDNSNNIAPGYPNEVSKEWYDKVNQFYQDQDKGEPTISK